MTAGRKKKFQLFAVTPFSGFVFKEKVLTIMKTYLLPLLLLCLLLPYPVSGTLPLYPSWTRIAACSFIAGLMVWFYLLSYPERCLRLKKADILMACYCTYLLVNDALCSPFHHSEKIAGIAALFLLYLLVRLYDTRHRLWLLLLFPAIGLLRFIYCYIYQQTMRNRIFLFILCSLTLISVFIACQNEDFLLPRQSTDFRNPEALPPDLKSAMQWYKENIFPLSVRFANMLPVFA